MYQRGPRRFHRGKVSLAVVIGNEGCARHVSAAVG
jgi:hypothetical protein